MADGPFRGDPVPDATAAASGTGGRRGGAARGLADAVT